METIKFSKTEIANRFAADEQLSEVIKGLEKEVNLVGKVICKVSVNGLHLSESDESRLASTSLGDIEEIVIEMEQVDTLVPESIKALHKYVSSLKEAVLNAADSIRQGFNPSTEKSLADVVEGVRWLTEALLALKPNLTKLKNPKVLQDTWVASEEHTKRTVEELLLGYQRQDFVLVSDVLEYELSSSLDQWLEILTIDC